MQPDSKTTSLDLDDRPEDARAGPNRTPKRKLDQIHGARLAKRANTTTSTPQDDAFRRGVFAGLCQADSEHKRTALQIAADANILFVANGLDKLADRTAQRWRQEFESNPGNFTSGPKVCMQGNIKFSDSEIKRTRSKFLEHHAFGARKVKRELKNEGLTVSTTYLRDLRKSNDPPIKPRKLKHKPKMTEAQQDYRVVFCQLHAGGPWRSWIFSDEFTIEVALGNCLIWNSTSAADVPVIPTTKDVARFHVFAAVSYDGTLTLQFYEAAMNSLRCVFCKRACWSQRWRSGSSIYKKNGLRCPPGKSAIISTPCPNVALIVSRAAGGLWTTSVCD